MSLSGWNQLQKFSMTIAYSDIPSSQSNMPILINLSASSGKSDFDLSDIFTKLGANSLKLAVENGDTGNQCYVEVERWDNATSVAQLWVKAPSLSSSADTVLNIYYDETHADNTTYVGAIGSTPGVAVWSNNYLHVYHLSQTPSGSGTVKDSLATIDGTSVNMDSSDLVTANIGKGLEFNGTDEHVSFSFAADITTATVELSVKSSTGTPVALDGIFSAYDDVGSTAMALMVGSTATNISFYRNNSDESSVLAVSSWTSWNHFSYTINATSENIKNHGEDTSTSNTDSLSRYIDAESTLSRWFSDDRRFPGVMRGLFISSVVRSDDWLDISYNSKTDNLITFDTPPIIQDFIITDDEEAFDLYGGVIILADFAFDDSAETFALVADDTKWIYADVEDDSETFSLSGTTEIYAQFAIEENETIYFYAPERKIAIEDGEEEFSLAGNTIFLADMAVDDDAETFSLTGLSSIAGTFNLVDDDETFAMTRKNYSQSGGIRFDMFRRCHGLDVTNYGIFAIEDEQEVMSVN